MIELKVTSPTVKVSGGNRRPRSMVAGLMVFALALGADAIMSRAPYSIPLSNLAYSAGHDTVPERVCIWFDRVDESWEVTPRYQRHIKERNMNTDEVIYRKPSTQAFIFSSVEANLINRICNTLVKTLDGFDHDLKNGRWDRCLYLDSYLASFFHEFYHLYIMCRASPKALPSVVSIADSLYDRSPESPKSDKRITQWRQTVDYIVKLRIATRELMLQIKQWQKKELEIPEKISWEDDAADFVQAYELFIRLYFNLSPPAQAQSQ
jgi:hypothetical protein